MKTALVCGAGGFIGSHFVKRLKNEGYWVRGVDLGFIPPNQRNQISQMNQTDHIDQTDQRRKNMPAGNFQYIVDEKGERTAVILPVEEYEELLEDIHDPAVIAERREEPTVAYEELKRKLREDGLLRD